MSPTIWVVIVAVFIFLVMGIVIYFLAKGKGKAEAESKSKDEILDIVRQLNIHYASVVDWVTEKRFNFHEMARNAKTLSDYTAIGNKLLEISSGKVGTATGPSSKPKI